MNKICITPVKNEEKNIELFLKVHTLIFDYILIFNHLSNDNTVEICKKFDKVEIIDYNNSSFDESIKRNFMITYTRNKFPGNNLIFHLDADEIVTSNVLNNLEFEELENLDPGRIIYLQHILLLSSVKNYLSFRNKSYGYTYMACGVVDNGKYEYKGLSIHSHRLPFDNTKDPLFINSFGLLHFYASSRRSTYIKNCHYMCLELINGYRRNFKKINRFYDPIIRFFLRYKDKKTPDSLYNGWKNYGIDLQNHSIPSRENYYAFEILKFFKKYGISYFKDLLIWEIDWEFYRKEAIKSDIKDIPDSVIIDPRNWYKRILHKLILKYLPLVIPYRLNLWEFATNIVRYIVPGYFQEKIFNYMQSRDIKTNN